MTTTTTAAQIATSHTLLPVARAFAAAVEVLRADAAAIVAAGCVDSLWTGSVQDLLADITANAARAADDVQAIVEDGDACVEDSGAYIRTQHAELDRLAGAVREIARLASRPVPADMGNLD